MKYQIITSRSSPRNNQLSMQNTKFPFSIAVVFIWIGFVGAISFMEAWLKFQAPGITLPLGLGIGRLVFSALNIMEWIFLVIIVLNYILKKALSFKSYSIYLMVPFIILILQTTWLLPYLDDRAQLIIDGIDLEPSTLHFVYIITEVIKLVCLMLFGRKLFRQAGD
jgi:uncharacterized membrane protein (DUF485 family)